MLSVSGEAQRINVALARDKRIGIIGLGRLGAASAEVFQRSGYELVGVSARSDASKARAEQRVPNVPVLSPQEVADRADCVILTVSDDAIAPVAEEIVAAGSLQAGNIVVHLSGRCGLEVLESARKASAIPLACHPAMTFAGTPNDANLLASSPFGITALPEHRELAEGFVQAIGGSSTWIAEDKRTMYHAAMVFGANNLISLIAVAIQAMAAAGIEDAGSFLAPILRASLENTIQLGPQALTGPVRRGDIGTLHAHIDALRELKPELIPGYVDFARFTAGMALREELNDAAILQKALVALQSEGAPE
ncbi:DUF2520 domain-containing protein [Streptomyces sp. NPDC001586]|uniref:Rossmann-like and DUF2520 domain-containing protein n=1 Tax=Streptomyces sp. NPDC001586 TaxID=3154387 RepID=UPI00332E8AF4